MDKRYNIVLKSNEMIELMDFLYQHMQEDNQSEAMHEAFMVIVKQYWAQKAIN